MVFVLFCFEWALDSEIQCWLGLEAPGSTSSPRVGVINILLPTSKEMGYGEVS